MENSRCGSEQLVMNIDERIHYLRKQIGIIEENKLIEEYKKIINNKDVSNNIKSKAYYAIGEVIEVIAPHLSEDNGYSYFKKAIEYDEENIEASIGICRIFNKYPAPFNSLVTEEENLNNLIKLLKNMNEVNDENIKGNIMSVVQSYLKVKLKIFKSKQ